MTLVYLVLAWLAGLFLGAQMHPPLGAGLALAAAGLVLALLGRGERSWRLAGALLALAGLGAARITLSPLYRTPLQPYLDGPPVTLTGVVLAAPDRRADRTELLLGVESAALGQGEAIALRDSVLLRVPREAPYRYGDRLRVQGTLRTPANTAGFDYRAYLARRGIHGIVELPEVEVLAPGRGSPVQAALIAVADRSEALITTLWPAPESALMAGILLGREQNLPEPLLQAFNDSGTRHIIAISGFNISLLAGALAAVLLTFFTRRAAAPIVVGLLACYVALVGADPSVVRAAIMGSLTLLALLAGRPADALTGLAASGLLMTLLNPWTLWEPGFQLSFAATLGLIVLVPRLEAWVARLAETGTEGTEGTEGTGGTEGTRGTGGTEGAGPFPSVPSVLPVPSVPPVPPVPSVPFPAWLREALLVSLAAQIATLPITLGTFGRLSLVAPLANLLVLPAQAALMELGALATLLAWLWRPLGQLLAYLAWPFVAWTIAVVRLLGGLPWAAVDLRGWGGLVPWALYALGGATLWARADPQRSQAVRAFLTRHLPTKAALTGLAAACVVLWVGVARLPDGKLHVTFLDVGQGDATLIRTPDGKRLLIDGGPDPTILPAELGRRLAPWDRRIDLVALTHPDEDHLAGLVEVLRRYDAGLILDTTLLRDTPSGQAWETLTFDVSRLTYPTGGATFDLGDGVRLQVLHPGPSLLEGTPSESNNNGLVLRLSYGRASFLLTGDLEMEGESYLLSQPDLPLGSTVLKVAHHGAKQGTSLRFLEAVQPQVAVISVGVGNRYGHPNPEVLARLEAAGVRVWRTDGCGDVEIVTDGERLWVRTGKACALPSAGG